jgi:hypothetical protein
MIVHGTIPVLTLEDLLKLLLLFTVYLIKSQRFGLCMPVRYIQLKQRDTEDIMKTASLL